VRSRWAPSQAARLADEPAARSHAPARCRPASADD
jgi:hypothetical protein